MASNVHCFATSVEVVLTVSASPVCAMVAGVKEVAAIVEVEEE